MDKSGRGVEKGFIKVALQGGGWEKTFPVEKQHLSTPGHGKTWVYVSIKEGIIPFGGNSGNG